MGKKLDALLMRRTFKADKFKATVSLAISRLAVMKNQRQARCSIARSDVVEFLNIGNHERALHRVDQVIKEQNMLDVLILLEGYCHLFLERVNLIEHEKVCPDELLEAVSSLIYASTRCGDFPELQEIRAIFALRFGKEFAARAVELRNNCGVNPKVIQKLSTRIPSLEIKMKILKEIASENNIVVHLPNIDDNTISDTSTMMPEVKESDSAGASGFVHHREENLSIHSDQQDGIDTPMKRKYKDVADAAQAAFESAAYAAEAARAAVELSRSDDDTGKGKIQNHREEGGEIVIREGKRSHSHDESGDDDDDDDDDDGEGSKRADEMDELKEPILNINRRPISVRTTRTR